MRQRAASSYPGLRDHQSGIKLTSEIRRPHQQTVDPNQAPPRLVGTLRTAPSLRRDRERTTNTRRSPEELVNTGRQRHINDPKAESEPLQAGSEPRGSHRRNVRPVSKLRGAPWQDFSSVESTRGGTSGRLAARASSEEQATTEPVPIRPPRKVIRRECGPPRASEEAVGGAPRGLATFRVEPSTRSERISRLRGDDRATQAPHPVQGFAGDFLNTASPLRRATRRYLGHLQRTRGSGQPR